MTSKRELELYFHIPFCVRKCLYCDFLSAPADEKTKARYMEALIRETSERAGDYRDYRVVSVFVGGGTPSAVDAGLLARLFGVVRESYDIAEDAEITVEINPGTVDEDMLCVYREAGVNRLSIGLQSADDRELEAIGRIHTFAGFLETYRTARDCGFTNVNVDLMSALPGQTLSDYLRTLKTVLALDPPPEHISAYSLIPEEGTPLYEMVHEGALQLPDEECDRLMYEKTAELLGEAGYHRYEISNYAREGFRCRHNCGYWQRREYLGLGIGAASLIGECRFRNGDSMEAYLSDPLRQQEERQELTAEERMEEFMFLGLRLTEGVSLREFRDIFDKEIEDIYGTVIDKNIKTGLLEYCQGEKGEKRLALTEKGLDVSNAVMAQFLL